MEEQVGHAEREASAKVEHLTSQLDKVEDDRRQALQDVAVAQLGVRVRAVRAIDTVLWRTITLEAARAIAIWRSEAKWSGAVEESMLAGAHAQRLEHADNLAALERLYQENQSALQHAVDAGVTALTAAETDRQTAVEERAGVVEKLAASQEELEASRRSCEALSQELKASGPVRITMSQGVTRWVIFAQAANALARAWKGVRQTLLRGLLTRWLARSVQHHTHAQGQDSRLELLARAHQAKKSLRAQAQSRLYEAGFQLLKSFVASQETLAAQRVVQGWASRAGVVWGARLEDIALWPGAEAHRARLEERLGTAYEKLLAAETQMVQSKVLHPTTPREHAASRAGDAAHLAALAEEVARLETALAACGFQEDPAEADTGVGPETPPPMPIRRRWSVSHEEAGWGRVRITVDLLRSIDKVFESWRSTTLAAVVSRWAERLRHSKDDYARLAASLGVIGSAEAELSGIEEEFAAQMDVISRGQAKAERLETRLHSSQAREETLEARLQEATELLKPLNKPSNPNPLLCRGSDSDSISVVGGGFALSGAGAGSPSGFSAGNEGPGHRSGGFLFGRGNNEKPSSPPTV